MLVSSIFKIDKKFIDEKKFLPTKKDVTEFDFKSKKFHVIIAENVFQYIHPYKFLTLWNDIYDSLEEGGYLIGSFVVAKDPNDERLKICSQMGIWFIKDIETAKKLFEMKYTNITFSCRENTRDEKYPEDPDIIFFEFYAQKT